MNLTEWTENFARARSAFHQDLVSMIWQHNLLAVKREKLEEFYVTSPALGVDVLEQADKYTNATIVTFASQENVNALLNDWQAYAKSPVKLLFVKADGNKVILNPSIHNKIADPETLSLGIKSMFGEE